ncbi:MAG: signal peptidase I [Oscillospiraceae bacterium]|nr:signal peptidase I [Oscillospiraceae bacterium]
MSKKENTLELPSLDQLAEELEREQYRTNYRRVLRSTLFSLLTVAAVAVLVAVLLLPILQITGSSMTNTLQDGDIVVAFSGSSYKTGDVIAFYYNNEILVKRVIATAGDWVNIDDEGNVFVNDKPLDEPYITDKSLGQCNIEMPYQVPDGRCFIMGDHRSTSIDSRNTAVGCISNDMVVGKIFIRIWPFEEISVIE